MGNSQQLIGENSLVIAVDFDGTIVENKYPKMGKEMLFAFDTLKALQKKGHRLILWTLRKGEELEEAVNFCKKNGVIFYAVNKNYPEELIDQSIIRKLHADIFIDDRNVGGFLGWGETYKLLHPEDKGLNLQFINPEAHQNHQKSFWGRILGK